MVRPRVPFVLV